MSLGEAIYDRLVADSTLTALLGTYLSNPCIFYPQVPPDAPRPYIVIDAPSVSGVQVQDAAGVETRAIEADVSAYCDFTGSAVTVDQIAARVLALLHANGVAASLSTPLAVSGYNGVHTSAPSGPVGVPTDDSIIGRAVRVRCTMERAS